MIKPEEEDLRNIVNKGFLTKFSSLPTSARAYLNSLDLKQMNNGKKAPHGHKRENTKNGKIKTTRWQPLVISWNHLAVIQDSQPLLQRLQ